MLDDLIHDMGQKGLVSFVKVNDIFAITEEIETDYCWWSVRAEVLAHDQDRMKVTSLDKRLN